MSKASEKTVSDRLDTTGGLTHLPSIPPAYECPHPHDAVGDVESIDSEEAEHEKHKYDRNHLPWIQVRTAGAAVARGSMQLVWGRQTVAGWAGAATETAPEAGLPSIASRWHAVLPTLLTCMQPCPSTPCAALPHPHRLCGLLLHHRHRHALLLPLHRPGRLPHLLAP